MTRKPHPEPLISRQFTITITNDKKLDKLALIHNTSRSQIIRTLIENVHLKPEEVLYDYPR